MSDLYGWVIVEPEALWESMLGKIEAVRRKYATDYWYTTDSGHCYGPYPTLEEAKHKAKTLCHV